MGNLILASSSPRRREILSMLGLNFEVVPANIEEKFSGNPIVGARKLARSKALWVWLRHKRGVVIGADTLVFTENRVLGKPENREEAVSMLEYLSGRWHRVVTAVSFVGKGVRVSLHDVARVKFRKLSRREIEEYVLTGEPLDKAGAYGIQGYGASIVERIEGSFYTVMGLPVHRVVPLLKELSILKA